MIQMGSEVILLGGCLLEPEFKEDPSVASLGLCAVWITCVQKRRRRVFFLHKLDPGKSGRMQFGLINRV